MPYVHVANVPEFLGLIDSVRGHDYVQISDARHGYITISSDDELVFFRREAGFKPAVWYSCLSGGVGGRIVEYGRETLRIVGSGRA